MNGRAATPRERILTAAADLLAREGRAGVSTRAVSSLARVQPPTIYRQFGDMERLLDEVARLGFTRYLEKKVALPPQADPVDVLREGWDMNVQFALDNPAIYVLMHAESRRRAPSPAARLAAEILQGLVASIGEAGRLRVSVETAASMIRAGGVGVALTLIEDGGDTRKPHLSEMTREAIISATTTGLASDAKKTPEEHGVIQHAVALKALLPKAAAAFSPAELALLVSWLDRLADSSIGVC